MPLITCPDCGAQVSDRAPTCPKCGAPIADRSGAVATGATLNTIQLTSKRLKTHELASALTLCLGLFWAIGILASGPREPGALGIPMALFVVGFAWFVITRTRVWWHHG